MPAEQHTPQHHLQPALGVTAAPSSSLSSTSALDDAGYRGGLGSGPVSITTTDYRESDDHSLDLSAYMTPAPQPDGAGASGAAPLTSMSVDSAPHSMGEASSAAAAHGPQSPSSTTASSSTLVDSQARSAAGTHHQHQPAAGPKTCARCGLSLDSVNAASEGAAGAAESLFFCVRCSGADEGRSADVPMPPPTGVDAAMLRVAQLPWRRSSNTDAASGVWSQGASSAGGMDVELAGPTNETERAQARAMPRADSFSRSHVGDVAMDGDEQGAAGSRGAVAPGGSSSSRPRIPVVNFPSSSSNIMAEGVSHGAELASRPRGPSRTSSSRTAGASRDPSRSPNRHGISPSRRSREERAAASSPTTLPPTQGSVLSSETPADAFGPSQMRRPRLSTLHPRATSALSAGDSKGPWRLPSSLEQPWNAQLKWFRAHRPDPRADISLQRTPPKGRGCLHPGAIFTGTQRSGRSSYEVSVQIVNVDFEQSHLAGYLQIKDLTDDWPELTTYFDAEIIGARHTFATNKWGAEEANDVTHWSRFTPFEPLVRELSRCPSWTPDSPRLPPGDLHFDHMTRPYVFMRWKERFLVPDHRVRDINGASFAGFYYVCVELDDSSEGPLTTATPEAPRRAGSTVNPAMLSSSQRTHSGRRRGAGASTESRSRSGGPRGDANESLAPVSAAAAAAAANNIWANSPESERRPFRNSSFRGSELEMMLGDEARQMFGNLPEFGTAGGLDGTAVGASRSGFDSIRARYPDWLAQYQQRLRTTGPPLSPTGSREREARPSRREGQIGAEDADALVEAIMSEAGMPTTNNIARALANLRGGSSATAPSSAARGQTSRSTVGAQTDAPGTQGRHPLSIVEGAGAMDTSDDDPEADLASLRQQRRLQDAPSPLDEAELLAALSGNLRHDADASAVRAQRTGDTRAAVMPSIPQQQQQNSRTFPRGGGRMSGFYFHENSEPYQQLTLQYVPETTSAVFELR